MGVFLLLYRLTVTAQKGRKGKGKSRSEVAKKVLYEMKLLVRSFGAIAEARGTKSLERQLEG